MPPRKQREIVVVGAGVIGLTTALLLQNEPDYQVTIVAKGNPDPRYMDADPFYASREAGAHWLAAAEPGDTRLQEMELLSLRTFLALSKFPETGVMQLRNKCISRKHPGPNWEKPWYASLVPDFRVLDAKQVPNGHEFGFEFTTVTIHVGKYLRWLMDRFQAMGGTIKVQSLQHIREALSVNDNDVDAVINCTGYGAKFLGGVQDDKMFATRGQTILVKPAQPLQETTTRIYEGDESNWSYIIPRLDGTVLLGGTFEPHNATLSPHPKTAKEILDRCRSISTALSQSSNSTDGNTLQVLRHGVGLRPFRVGGIRLEAELLTSIQQTPVILVHNYGHGSYGYQASWGSCQKVVELLAEKWKSQESARAQL